MIGGGWEKKTALFAFEFLGWHEEIKQGCQRLIDSDQAGMFFNPLKLVIADIITDNSAVFLFHEAVVVFLVATTSGKRHIVFFTQCLGVIVNKFRTVIRVKLQNRKKGLGVNVGQSLERPPLGVVEQGFQF